MSSTNRARALILCVSAALFTLGPAGCGGNGGDGAYETGASDKKKQLEELHQKATEKKAASKK